MAGGRRRFSTSIYRSKGSLRPKNIRLQLGFGRSPFQVMFSGEYPQRSYVLIAVTISAEANATGFHSCIPQAVMFLRENGKTSKAKQKTQVARDLPSMTRNFL